MGQGIEIFNPDGSRQFSIGDRVVRMLRVQSTGTSNGSVSVAAAASKGTLVPVVAPKTTTGIPPTAAVSGGTLSWDFGSTPAGSRADATILRMGY